MHIDPYILAFSAVTVIVTVFMGFWSAKKSKTAGDFFVAGRSVSVGWNASAISGEYLSAASFMGIAGMVMSSGYDALWYPVCYACGYLFLLLFIAGPLRRFGAYTIPDFAEGRYDSPVFRKIAVCFVLFIGFFYTMPQMKGAGVTLAYIFPGLPYWVGVVLVGAVITLNVALGGMKGITLVQAFQYWAKMFAISVPIFVLMAVYGGYGKQLEENSPNTTPVTTGSLEVFLPQTWKVIAINGNSNELFLKLNEAKAAVSRNLGKPSLQAGNFDVFSALRLFAANHGHHQMLMAQSAPGYAQMTNPISVTSISTTEKWEQDVRVGLRSNGVDVIVASDALVVVPVAKHAEYEAEYSKRGMSAFEPEQASLRKPLPEKAPADSTWLSPFGPLTTKAAKAAASPRVLTDFELILDDEQLSSQIAALGQTVYAPNLIGQIERLNATFKKPTPQSWRTMIPVTSSNIMAHMPAPLLGYAATIGKPILWQTNMSIQPFMVDVSHTARTTDAEMAARLELALRSNGVALVTSPQGAVIAVESAELQKLRAEFGVKPAAISQESVRPYALLYTYSLIIALVCGTAGLPHILVRFYTNPDGVAAKRTTMWVMILIGIFYVFPPVFGVMGRNLMPELYNGLTGVKGTDGIVLRLPTILREKYGTLGSILSGVTCAGAFAAFMSTFSGLLVSMTGALAHDVYGRMLRPKSTPENRLRAFKVCAVLIGGIAIVLGCFVEPLEINFMVGQAFAIAAASYFPLLFMSVWWRGMTMRGAAIGMLTGGLCALFAVALTNVSNLASDKGPMGIIFAGFAPMNNFWAGHPLLRILCEQPAVWTVPLAIGLMIVISKFTHKDVPSDVRAKMLVLHAPEKLGLKQEYIQEHQHGH